MSSSVGNGLLRTCWILHFLPVLANQAQCHEKFAEVEKCDIGVNQDEKDLGSNHGIRHVKVTEFNDFSNDANPEARHSRESGQESLKKL